MQSLLLTTHQHPLTPCNSHLRNCQECQTEFPTPLSEGDSLFPGCQEPQEGRATLQKNVFSSALTEPPHLLGFINISGSTVQAAHSLLHDLSNTVGMATLIADFRIELQICWAHSSQGRKKKQSSHKAASIWGCFTANSTLRQVACAFV